MADDVTQKRPLRGGRQRANHIQVHRIEFGKWERDNLGKPLASVADEALAVAQTVRVARTMATVAGAAALAGLSYTAYKVGKAAYGWTEDIYQNKEAISAGIEAGVGASQFGPIVRVLRALF